MLCVPAQFTYCVFIAQYRHRHRRRRSLYPWRPQLHLTTTEATSTPYHYSHLTSHVQHDRLMQHDRLIFLYATALTCTCLVLLLLLDDGITHVMIDTFDILYTHVKRHTSQASTQRTTKRTHAKHPPPKPSPSHHYEMYTRRMSDSANDSPDLGSTNRPPWAPPWIAFSLYTYPLGSAMGGLCSFIISRVIEHNSLLCTCLLYGKP